MRILVVVALVGLLVTACGAGAGPGGPSVEGRTYLSTGVTEDGGTRELVPGSRVQVSFVDGRVSASAGCNSMSGAYRLVDGTLVVEPMAMTEMGCPEELMSQDAWLADLLTAEPALAVDGDTLTLTTASTVLTLLDRELADPDRPLVGTTWLVDSLITGETVSSAPGGAEASLTLAEDGSAQVMAGCNRGRGSWAQGEGTLTVSALALTRMACPGDRGELERAVLAVLEAGELGVEITADRLTLTAGDLGLGLRAG
ncbi:META domain-containing protein [Ornithinimicrobium cerasi]|uniref:META domain-containing protein n=1 Tax=Ornithinimicrobium cerasi TaxID=2248773 RepID=UPI000EFF3AD0|nr:META domain-containing protein [Ornithinimicrobium cerasi]